MGRTVKISELKKFDVFQWKGLDNTYVYLGGSEYNFVLANKIEHIPNTFKYWDREEDSVELLGRMEFVENQPIHNISDEDLDTMRNVFL